MTRWFLTSALLVLAPFTVQAASPIAEVICAPSPDMDAKLKSQFGAKRQASGIRSPQQVMEIWTAQNGDWTMIVRYAAGTSCIVAMGDHWVQAEAENPA